MKAMSQSASFLKHLPGMLIQKKILGHLRCGSKKYEISGFFTQSAYSSKCLFKPCRVPETHEVLPSNCLDILSLGSKNNYGIVH